MRFQRFVLALLSILLVLLCVAPSSQAFSNGRASLDELAQVHTAQSGKHAYESKNMASALNDMRSCAVRAGVDLTPNPSVYNPAATAYRNIAVQTVLWQDYQSGRGNLAAYPGTSNHGWGNAIDLSPSSIRYVSQHGGRWNIRKVEALGEPWHWNHVGGAFPHPDPGISLLYPVLRTGSGGQCMAPAVQELQRLIGVKPSGGFGDGTRRVVKEKQRDLICKKCGTGIVGPTTWKVFRKAKPIGNKHPRPQYVQLTSPTRMRGQDVTVVIGLLNARRKELKKPQVHNDATFNHSDSLALKNFQRARHLDASGIAGVKTLKALATPSKAAQKANQDRIASAQKAGFEVKSVKKAQKDYGCAKVHTDLKRQTCKVRVLRGQWLRRDHYAKTLHGHQRGVWMTRAKNTRKRYNQAKATLHKLERVTHVDDRGVKFVADFEGLFHRCYNDPVGFATIGYGHLLHYSRCSADDNRLFWSTSRALSELRKDLRATEAGISQIVRVKLNQGEFNALTSWGFNVGLGGVRSSSLVRKLNAGCYACVPAELRRWSIAGGRVFPGLLRRRVAEGKMFVG